MFLHADDPAARLFSVWHAPRCRFLTRVFWVDDQAALWCEWTEDCTAQQVHRARRIDIHVARKLVVIDPIDDADAGDVRTVRRVTDDETA